MQKQVKYALRPVRRKKMELVANLKKQIHLAIRVKKDLLTLLNLTITQIKVLVQSQKLKNAVKRNLKR